MISALILFALPIRTALGFSASCHPVLWKKQDFSHIRNSKTAFREQHTIASLSSHYLKEKAHPIRRIASAGKINPHDHELVISRRAFGDAGRAAMLALAYQLYNEPAYINKVENILLAWAKINEPTGHPIDETRLEGFIWAYDLVACHLSENSRAIILSWFEKIRFRKSLWHFGPLTKNNNHHTHQLKMELLLDKVLHRPLAEQKDRAHIHIHLKKNINMNTGETIDYHERTALYYQNFDLEPWLEISLVTGCCQKSVSSAFNFIASRILNHHLEGEFLHSIARIDYLRGQNGFAYAKAGRKFQVSRATDSIITYYTIMPDPPSARLWNIANNHPVSPWTHFLMYRRMFWSVK